MRLNLESNNKYALKYNKYKVKEIDNIKHIVPELDEIDDLDHYINLYDPIENIDKTIIDLLNMRKILDV